MAKEERAKSQETVIPETQYPDVIPEAQDSLVKKNRKNNNMSFYNGYFQIRSPAQIVSVPK